MSHQHGGAALAADIPASQLQTDVPLSQDPHDTDDAPVYMSSMISHYTPGRALCSASATMRLAIPRTRLACADRCFSASAATFWNALPPHLHHCSTLRTFKTNLKPHLVRQHFSQTLIFYVTVLS